MTWMIIITDRSSLLAGELRVVLLVMQTFVLVENTWCEAEGRQGDSGAMLAY